MILYDKLEGAYWLLYVPLAAQLTQGAEDGFSTCGMHDFGDFIIGWNPTAESYILGPHALRPETYSCAAFLHQCCHLVSHVQILCMAHISEKCSSLIMGQYRRYTFSP